MKTIVIIFILITLIYSTPLTCNEAMTIAECTDIINGIHECIWFDNKCQFKTCQHSSIPCDGLVYQGELCSNSKQGCQSIKKCSDIDNQESCTILKPYGIECFWDQQCIQKNCQHNSISNCKLTNGQKCIYQHQKCSSINQCNDIIEKSSCLVSQIQGLNCIWMNNKCAENSCLAISTKEECFKSIRNSEKCFFTQNQSNDNSCISCSLLTQQCKCDEYMIFGCQWQNNSCQELSCSTYLNQIQCRDDSQCIWYKPMNKCLTIQEASQNDRACDIYIFSTILHICTIFLLLAFCIFKYKQKILLKRFSKNKSQINAKNKTIIKIFHNSNKYSHNSIHLIWSTDYPQIYYFYNSLILKFEFVSFLTDYILIGQIQYMAQLVQV
ncbi:unnamed protein product [Paramecium sonneborni]|uniref:Transmembrane protein n=1 Tax=Paramecium sonneborni TaxID=65129 RepID=A0A8S1QRJ4_9CILI|nr:unnamed protein product [Paramecium sonneborni]